MQINTGARTNNLTGCFTFFLTLIGSQIKTTFNLEVHVRLMSLLLSVLEIKNCNLETVS